jgi:hypothetical protein
VAGLRTHRIPADRSADIHRYAPGPETILPDCVLGIYNMTSGFFPLLNEIA